MRSPSSGPITTLLMLIPLVAVPFMAAVGIPDLTWLSESEAGDNVIRLADTADADKSAAKTAADLFAPISEFDDQSEPASFLGNGPDEPLSHEDEKSQIPTAGGRQNHDSQPMADSNHSNVDWSPPNEALDGWRLDSKQPQDPGLASRAHARGTANDSAAPARARQGGGFHEPRDDAIPRIDGSNSAAAEIVDRREGELPWSADATIEGTTEPKYVPALDDRLASELEQNHNGQIDGSMVPKHWPTSDGTAMLSNNEPAGDEPLADTAAGDAEVKQSPRSDETLTWRKAVQRLNELGIRDYQLLPGERPNEFYFSCCFTPSDNPRITHRFEAEALEPLTAVEKVLQQIEERFGTKAVVTRK